MPQALVLQVGTGEVRIPIKLTAAQLRIVMKRHARRVGIQVEGKTDVQVAEAVLKRFLREAGDNASQEYQQEQIAVQIDAIQAQARAETELIDPEPPLIGG